VSPRCRSTQVVTVGLFWVRRKQRVLTKSVLAVFCLAWLQMAALPCMAAHAARVATDGNAGAAMASDAGHQHGAHHAGAHFDPLNGPAGESGSGPAKPPCHYCPPSGESTDCGSGNDCAFPHDLQIDLRAAGAMALLLPVPTAFVPRAATRPVRVLAYRDSHAAISRPPLNLSYCRFLE